MWGVFGGGGSNISVFKPTPTVHLSKSTQAHKEGGTNRFIRLDMLVMSRLCVTPGLRGRTKSASASEAVVFQSCNGLVTRRYEGAALSLICKD